MIFLKKGSLESLFLFLRFGLHLVVARKLAARFLSLRIPNKIFFAKPKCEPATSHTCSKGGVVEAICLPVASNLFANRSPHCVRDDNPVTCHCEKTCRALLVIANSERVKQSTRDDNLLTDGHVVLQDSSP